MVYVRPYTPVSQLDLAICSSNGHRSSKQYRMRSHRGWAGWGTWWFRSVVELAVLQGCENASHGAILTKLDETSWCERDLGMFQRLVGWCHMLGCVRERRCEQRSKTMSIRPLMFTPRVHSDAKYTLETGFDGFITETRSQPKDWSSFVKTAPCEDIQGMGKMWHLETLRKLCSESRCSHHDFTP